MIISGCFITGAALGIEYVQKHEDNGVEHSCIVIDLLIYRLVLEFPEK